MDNERELYAWCCLQSLLNKAGYLSEERKEKLRELTLATADAVIIGEGRGVDFFEYYEREIEKNHDSFRLVVEEEGETV